MILIWDNGESWSTHRLYFIDCGEHPIEGVAAACALAIPSGHEVARAEALDWRSAEAMSTPDDMIDNGPSVYELSPAQLALVEKVPPGLLERFVQSHPMDLSESDRDFITAEWVRRSPA